MNWITGVFYTIDGKSMVIYKHNYSSNFKLASKNSERYKKEFMDANKQAKNVNARTFEYNVPSYDLR